MSQPAGTEGVLHIPMLLLMMILIFSGLGFLGLLQKWRFQVETQLRINRCVGTSAIEFRDSLNSLITNNRQIDALRAAIVAASLQPELIPPLRGALHVLVGKQELTLLKWNARRVKWFSVGSCGNFKDVLIPLPILDFKRGPPDEVGPQALQWQGQGQMPTEFFVQASHFPRSATSRIYGGRDGSPATKTGANCRWTAEWTTPRFSFM